MPDVDIHINKERADDFDKAEMDLLRHALKRTYKERFEIMMHLIKNNLLFKKAKITHYKGSLPDEKK